MNVEPASLTFGLSTTMLNMSLTNLYWIQCFTKFVLGTILLFYVLYVLWSNTPLFPNVGATYYPVDLSVTEGHINLADTSKEIVNTPS